ncbi:MAG: DUF2330 domain-containing protein [Myxococcota bacterium]
MRRPHLVPVALAGAFALLLVALLPRPAAACGGFVCGTFATVPPVVQDAERIVFVDSGPEKTDAIVQVLYEGAIDDFAWVIPVPGVPTLGTSDPQLFDDLEASTAPSVFFQAAPATGGGAACGADAGFALRSDSAGAGAGVEIVGTANVGPYETVTLTGDDAEAVIDWLVDNGYAVPDAAVPLFERYVAEGRYFVALRLAATADLKALEPLRLTYDSDELCIPIRLTAIATAPVLAVTAWFLAPEPVVPSNYALVEVPTARLRQNGDGTTNYGEIAREVVQAAGGQAFINQFTGTLDEWSLTPAMRDGLYALAPLPPEQLVLTRLFTDIRAEDMDADPLFEEDASAPHLVAARLVVPPPGRTRCAAGPLAPGLRTLAPLALALLLVMRRRRRLA